MTSDREQEPPPLGDLVGDGPTGADLFPQPPARRAQWWRRRWLVVALALVAVLSAVGIWQAISTSSGVDTTALSGPTGQAAPSFSLPNLEPPGHEISLASFRGRPLVVNFWASWCVPCRTEMPLLEQAYQAHHGTIAFVGIDSNDTPGVARAFLQQVHVTYVALSDTGGSTATDYGLFGLPTTVFISASGKIIGRHIGELHADTLAGALSEAFHE